MLAKFLALVLAGLAVCAGMVGCGAAAACHTEWFDFTVHSIKKVDSYAGHVPGAGYALYDVRITERNTFGSAIAMGTRDFYMDDPGFEEYIWPMAPLDATMMPEEFSLEPGKTARYHMVFEAPSDAAALVLLYTELNEDGAQGATFEVPVEM